MMGKYIHDSNVINDAFDCCYVNLATASDLVDIGKLGLRKVWKFINLLRQIILCVMKIRPRLVYVTPNACGGAFYKDFIVVEMLKCLGCKVVLHYHNKGVATRQGKIFDDLLYKIFFVNVNVILLSKKLYADIQKYVKEENVFYCSNGIPDNVCCGKERRHTAGEVTKMLFLSNLIESKGVIVLLDALKILKEKGVSFICNFIGGETKEFNSSRFKDEIMKRGLGGNVLFRGKKYGEDKNQIFKETDIFVFPTYYPKECFPVVLLEAMQYALPCVGTNEGGIPDIIDDGKTGFIVPRKDSEALASTLGVMLADRELCERMGRAGRQKYERMFTLGVFENNMCGVLRTLVKDGHS